MFADTPFILNSLEGNAHRCESDGRFCLYLSTRVYQFRCLYCLIVLVRQFLYICG